MADNWEAEAGAPEGEAAQLQALVGGEPVAEIKLFGKWSTSDIDVSDYSLTVSKPVYQQISMFD